MISRCRDWHPRSGPRLREDDPINLYAMRKAHAPGGISLMNIIEIFALIQFVDNGWTLAAFAAVLVYLYLTR